jgi:general secretion pathway protein G
MRRQKGFTLIELLIVVAIIGIIAAIAIPNLLNAINRGRQKRTMADLRSLATAIESYQVDFNFYPKVGAMAAASTLSPYLSPTYIKRIPDADGWNQPLCAELNTEGTTYREWSMGKGASSHVRGVRHDHQPADHGLLGRHHLRRRPLLPVAGGHADHLTHRIGVSFQGARTGPLLFSAVPDSPVTIEPCHCEPCR